MNTRTVRRSVTLVLGVVLALLVVGMTQALAAGNSHSQANGPNFDTIDAYVQEQIQEMRIPGAELGIVKGDKIVHLEGFGDADDSGRQATPQTPFKIGSMSKSAWGGLRIGWVRAAPRLIRELAAARADHDIATPVLDAA